MQRAINISNDHAITCECVSSGVEIKGNVRESLVVILAVLPGNRKSAIQMSFEQFGALVDAAPSFISHMQQFGGVFHPGPMPDAPPAEIAGRIAASPGLSPG